MRYKSIYWKIKISSFTFNFSLLIEKLILGTPCRLEVRKIEREMKK
jgi:hypothetical protein